MRGTRIGAMVVALSLTAGCAAWQGQNRTVKGAVYGSGGGAAAGAAIGAALGGGEGAWKGAAVGAAIGALGGGLVGNYMDRQAKEMQAVLDRQDRLEREGQTLRVALTSDTLFESGSAKLQPGAQDKLRQIAQVLQRYPRTRLEIVGHTDSRGTEESNQSLSQRRAGAVREALVGVGVDRGRITSRGARGDAARGEQRHAERPRHEPARRDRHAAGRGPRGRARGRCWNGAGKSRAESRIGRARAQRQCRCRRAPKKHEGRTSREVRPRRPCVARDQRGKPCLASRRRVSCRS